MMLVDYSGAAGVDGLIVLSGCPLRHLPGGNSRVPDLLQRYSEKLTKVRFTPVRIGRQEVMVITACADEDRQHPVPTVDNNSISVGGQSIIMDGYRFRLKTIGRIVEQFTGDVTGFR